MQRILLKVYGSRRLSGLCRAGSYTATALVAAIFLSSLVWVFLSDRLAALRILVGAICPFFVVSIVRRIINAPRPYEVYRFYETPPSSRSGSSFPSRHVFSAFTVAALLYPYSIPLAVIAAVSGLLLAVSRVLLGIHFIRDAVCGAILGIASGIIAILIIL